MSISDNEEVMDMKKEMYERSQIEIIEFVSGDVILSSSNPDDEYEGENPNGYIQFPKIFR